MLIPKPERQSNGYRIFTDFHIEQFRLARLAFQIEVLQNGLRKKIVKMIKVSATGDFDTAISIATDYLKQVQKERENAEETIEIVKRILSGGIPENTHFFKRKEVSEYLGNFYGRFTELGNEWALDSKAQTKWVSSLYESNFSRPVDRKYLNANNRYGCGDYGLYRNSYQVFPLGVIINITYFNQELNAI